ncbi:MAG: glutamate formimidoyltransferase [Candidatus Cloacimonadaceae bacterium]|nr:glutamate formimidoyltransferase [Candidatus Cloacimonadota bacterium]MCK9177546.1 glutamate formimidoyltransferase [Candidatus Cloacimonadota bacterium]MDD3102793.1 glutamate formimidoyltransferase [Candidatus Cloacimonadota bacterium]MDD3533040.1 glutamate formimidoyltransferase [Candidatus Cloacimonadota bacterium]MDY0126520.1 glutamate formimidoyltransferase [Candidatus Cloacimonadaceae bacterium]
MKLMECVPNFSEGRDQGILDAIADAIKSVKNVSLLDVDPGADTNRTVFTMAGEPEAVVEAAFQAIKKASELIDMSKHKGEHPRMGATDVCPFIPISDMSMEECVEYAKKLGKRVGEELNIPVYLYENAASKPEWKNLANVRSGEYEALAEKAKNPDWKPDFGPHSFNAKSGATAISAREFLIAYNINLNTRDKSKAHDIALSIRESGRLARDEKGKLIRDEAGKRVRVPGIFTHCKAVGWYIDGYNRAQISINLTNYKITPPHAVLDKVREMAHEMGMEVTGSELVGLIPKAAILESGKYYLNKMNESTGIPEKMIMETAIQSMGLAELSPFDLDKKVIEYAIAKADRLATKSVTDFCDLLSTDSPTPGGGSVAALCLAMSGALSAMVANLTIDKKGYEKVQDAARKYAPMGQEIKESAIRCVDVDSDAFDSMMEALRLPKKTDEEIAYRNQQIELGTQAAIIAPLNVLRISLRALQLAKEVAKIGNINALSDAGVAALTALAAAKAANFNVLINISGITDEDFKKNTLAEAKELIEKCVSLNDEVEKDVSSRL